MPMRPLLVVGHIVKPQGVKGEVKVRAESDPERFIPLKSVMLGDEGQGGERRVLSARVRDGMAYLRLEGVETREDAEKLRGTPLCALREALPKLPDGTYYICDLIGCEVFDETGASLGVLADVLQAGGNDCWVVEGPKSFSFPAVKDALIEVDLSGRRVVLSGARLAEVAVYDD